MECPFCDLQSEENANRVYEQTKNYAVIFSNPHKMSGHLLVIPKRHVEAIWDLTPEERSELFEVLCDLQKRITSTLSTGCDIRQNYRPFLEQSKLKVDHIHFHLLPREFGDELFTECEIDENKLWKDLTAEEVEKTTQRLNDKQI